MAERLTKQKIDAFAYAGGWDVRWDNSTTGLGIRIYESGKKSFVLSYRSRTGSRRKRLMVLGPVGVLTLDQARSLAISHLATIRQGVDPAEARKRSESNVTIATLFDHFLNNYAKVHKKSWKDDERRLRSHIPKQWLSRSPTEITRTGIQSLHQQLGERAPYEANRLLALLRVVFNECRRAGLLPPGHENPASDIKPFKEKSRKRAATQNEVQRIAAAIDEEPSIYIRALIWLYLLTGARRNELLERSWADYEPEQRRLRLDETKAGETQFVPLSAPALAILESLPRVEHNPFIFPGAKPGKHFVNISKPWKRILNKAGVEGLRLHDLRRTVGSWMSQDGTDLNAVKAALRHNNISTTLVYARLTDQVAADAIERHGQRMMEIRGKLVAKG